MRGEIAIASSDHCVSAIGRPLHPRRVMIFHPPRDVGENVGGDEEYIQHTTAAVQADQGELVCQADGKGDVVDEGKAEEEDAGDEGQDRAKEGEAGMRMREGGQNQEREVVDEGWSDGREGVEGTGVRERMKVGAGGWEESGDGGHYGLSLKGGE